MPLDETIKIDGERRLKYTLIYYLVPILTFICETNLGAANLYMDFKQQKKNNKKTEHILMISFTLN